MRLLTRRHGGAHARSRTRRRTLGAALAGALAVVGLTPYADAAQVTIGPLDPSTSFPMWVADSSTGTRLDLCLDAPQCLGTQADLVGPDGEAFWYNASTTVAGKGASGLYEVATEAAFAGTGEGQQIAFNRVRIRLDVNSPGTYEVRHPYGTKTYFVSNVDSKRQEINDTVDIGCATPPCGDFGALADSGDGGVGGSWLRWDTGAPTGFLGDGLTEHTVTGSPIGRNFLDVVRTTDDQRRPLATPEVAAHMTRFAVQGRVARPTVVASPSGGSFKGSVTVQLVGSEPGAQVYYTDNGAAPANADGTLTADAKPYTDPLTLTTTTTIKAVNVADNAVVTDPVTGQPSAASSDTFTIDAGAPTLSVDPAGGTFTSAPQVTLTATDNEPGVKIFYELGQGTDPVDPTNASTLYTGPVAINGNADGTPTILKAIAIDSAGNTSTIVRESYTVSAATVSASPKGGSYGTAQDVTLTATDPDAKIYFTIDGTDPAVDVTGTATNGTLYINDPIHLTANTTLKFLAVTASGQSSVMTENYLIDIPANRPTGALGSVGPVDNANGYPFWYGDKGGTDAGLDPVRVELCLDDPLCPVVGERPDPNSPPSLPDNFPDESFWWSAESSITAPSGASGLLVLAQEAAFGGTGEVAIGQQAAFARLRIRIDDVAPEETYTVTSPYGVDVVQADDRGRVFYTEDVGCLAAPCGDWKQPLDGRIGPFLRWDPNSGTTAPAGYLGDGATEHKVVGSPHGTNFFRIEGPGLGADSVQTDMFVVQGKIATLQATVAPAGGLYSGPQTVTMTPSFPDEAKIVYTTDGTEPTVDATGAPTGTTVQGPLPDATAGTTGVATAEIPAGATTLKFMAVNVATNATSRIYTETYQVDGQLPTVTATPDPSGSPFQGGQVVHLTAQLDGTDMATQPQMYYTTDGTLPKVTVDSSTGTPVVTAQGTTQQYDDAAGIPIGRPTTLNALAVSELGSVGPAASFSYVIQNLAAFGPISPDNAYPTWFEDYGNTAQGLAPVRLALCLDDPLCLAAGTQPDPSKPMSFPGNFPDEAFWWAGDASIPVGAGGRARLTLAAEAAFGGAGDVAVGQQVGFGRTRLFADSLVPGATYKITQPYGVLMLTADDAGAIRYTDDSGCLNSPCQWGEILKAPIGPFLRWTGTDAPAGYVGDPGVAHTVTGSPFGTNLFKMEQVTDGTGAGLVRPVLVGETDLFNIQGKLASLQVTASPKGGTFTAAQSISLSSNEAAAKIFYTLDGSDPSDPANAQRAEYAAALPIATEGENTLKFVAEMANADGTTSRSAVGTEVYTIDTGVPTVTADPAGGQFAASQAVTLSTDDATAKIYYTTNGSTPSATSTAYSGPITVSKTSTLKAVAIDPAGNASAIGSWNFTIGLPTTTLTLGTPTPDTVAFGGTTTLAGKLTADGVAQSGRSVVLQARAIGSTTWNDVSGTAPATTGADGGYSFAGVKPTASTDYRASFAGDSQFQAQVSAPQRVGVRAILTLNAPTPVSPNRGKTVTYSGKVDPAHTGSRISITVSQAGQRSLTASATTAADGTWSVSTKAPGKTGTWTITASWAGDADHLGATASRTMTVAK